jgi:hypothetical protein
MLFVPVSSASAQAVGAPRVALDSAWRWGVEAGVGNGLTGTALRRAGPRRAWILGATAFLHFAREERRGDSADPFSGSSYAEGSVSTNVGYRWWRAGETRIVPFSEVGMTANVFVPRSGGAMTQVGPYASIGAEYFIDARVAIGGATSLGVLYAFPRETSAYTRDRGSLFLQLPGVRVLVLVLL